MVLHTIVKAQVTWWRMRTRLADARGATAIEYGLMLALIAAVIVVAVTLLGENTTRPFEDVSNRGFTGGS
ncbi:MAG TPA: Flp family type IVb pilin [Actinomycetota bacterium]|nr:Flp family type IVb pilin [Actinomycetota bacterium]